MSLELVRPPNRAQVNNPMNNWSNTGNETAPQRTQPALTFPSGLRIQVAFTGIGSCLISGSHSHQAYYFSSDHPEQSIAVEDAPELLHSGVFRLALRSWRIPQD